jgi:hypothetical protein
LNDGDAGARRRRSDESIRCKPRFDGFEKLGSLRSTGSIGLIP